MTTERKPTDPWSYIQEALVLEDRERTEEAALLARTLELRLEKKRKQEKEALEVHRDWLSRLPDEVQAPELVMLLKITGLRKIPRAMQRYFENFLALPSEEQDAIHQAQRHPRGFDLWLWAFFASCAPEELEEILEELYPHVRQDSPSLTLEELRAQCLPEGDHKATWEAFLEESRARTRAASKTQQEQAQGEADGFEKMHRADDALERGPFERFLARQQQNHARQEDQRPAEAPAKEKPTYLSPSEVIQETWKNFVERGISRWHTSRAHDPSYERSYHELTEPYALARGWCFLLNARDPNRYHFALAREALAMENATGEDHAAHELALALFRDLKAALPLIGLERAGIEDNPHIPEEEGMLAFDARAARYLEKKGPAGKLIAEAVRRESRERWQAYTQTVQPTLPSLPPPPPASLWRLWADLSLEVCPVRFALILALVLWRDVVKPLLEKEREKPRALVFPIFEGAIKIHAPGVHLEDKEGQPTLLSRDGEVIAPLQRLKPLEIPTLELSTLPQILPKGSKLLGSLNAYRLLHLEVSMGHRRVLEGATDARALRFEGGWAAIAEKIGAKGSKAADEIHAIVVTQAHLCWTWPDGSKGNLLSYESRLAKRGQRARVSIILGDALLPDFLFSPGFFGNGRTAREARRLVPVPPLPPLIGRDNEKGAQANLHLRIIAEMRKRAMEFYQQGGILLLRSQLEELAVESGLPPTMLDQTLERWLRDGLDGPSALAQVSEDKDRYTLGPSHRIAIDFITEAGRDEFEGSQAGKLSRELDRKGKRKK